MDLDEIVDELYGLPPADFTAARDARAAAARKDGDRELAGQIKKLRRPTVSAWLANRLARERADDLGRLLELADALHDAQDRLAGDELRRLTQQRRQVVAALATEAAAIAGQRGQSLSATVERELLETFDAALSDRTAADVLRSGRLTGPLSYAGLGVEDPTAVLAIVPAPAATPGPAKTTDTRTDTRTHEPTDEVEPGTARKAGEDEEARHRAAAVAAKQAVDAAEQALTAAARRAEREGERVDRLRAEHAAAAQRADEARRELESLEADEQEAAADLAAAEAAVAAAEDARSRAEEALSGARDAAAALEG